MHHSVPAKLLDQEKMVGIRAAANRAARVVAKNGGKPYSGGKFGGKGKDGKGPSGYKGKGHGPAEGCWACGGPHFSYLCPQNGGDKGQPKGGIRSLCGLQIVPMQAVPMESNLFNVFRRAGATYAASISKAIDGKETFYPIVSRVSEKPVKKICCKRFEKNCCNRFECLGEEVDDFEPIGNQSLNVNVERASRAKIEFEKKTMALMGSGKAVKGQGVVKAQIKKTLVKGKGPLMGKDMLAGGRALREAPFVHRRTYAQAVSGGKQVATSGSAQVPVTGTSVPPLSTLGSLGSRMPEGLKSVDEGCARVGGI